MDKPCDICGSGVKNKQFMACCSQCNRAREHIYCMRVMRQEVPVEWSCDQCLSSNKRSTLEGGLKKESSRPPCFKSKKSNGTGKMKFISPEEAIKLSSGAMRPVPPRSSFMTSNDTASKFSTPLPSKVVKPKFSPRKVKASPSLYASGCPKTPQKGCEQIKPVTNRQQSQILNELEEPKAIATTVNDHICNEEPLNSFTCGEETGTYDTNTEKASYGDVHQTSPEFKNPSIEDIGPLSLSAYRYLVYRPAQDVTWKGGFKIDGEFYDGFWGKPPFRVRRKAYDFSKTMYPVLEVKLVHRCPLWTNLFRGGDPDFCDIGLYFLPGNLERSKNNLARLLELMEIDDVAMETCINGVELLIFTCSKLHVNSEMLIDGEKKRFLWGVFCPGMAKAKPTDCSSPVEGNGAYACSSPVEGNDAYGEDMEIDMIGGEMVGSVDVCVPSSRCCDETTLQLQQRHVLTIEQQQVKLECELGMQNMDFPPGFEKISRQKVMDKDPPSSREEVRSCVKSEKMDV